MLNDEAAYTVWAVNGAGTCIGTAYLTVPPATARERTAKELIEYESTRVTVTIRIRINEDSSSRTAAAVNKSKDATTSTRPEDGRAADRRSVTRVGHVQSVQ